MNAATGATGATGGLNAYGGARNTAPQAITTILGTQSPVGLEAALPLNNVTVAGNSVTVATAGTYQLYFVVQASLSVATTLTVAARVNGADIPQATVARLLSVGGDGIFTITTLVDLPAGAVVDLVVSSALVAVVTIPANNAQLSVELLD